MHRNLYFTQGTRPEQTFHEDLIVESLSIYGQSVYYIPRSLVAKDEILGEDRLSEFKTAYPIEMYFENVDGFDGQGAFIQKFGLMMEQSATLVVARRRWNQLVGKFKSTIIPERPCEGDLIYFPLSGGLFEIKFVQHQDPFYQIGKLYVYKLQVELFQYSSERLNTGVKEIDDFETLKSFDLNVIKNGVVTKIEVTDGGRTYTKPPIVSIGNDWLPSTIVTAGQQIAAGLYHYEVVNDGTLGTISPTHDNGIVYNGTAQLRFLGLRATAISFIDSVFDKSVVSTIEVKNGGSGYRTPPVVNIITAVGATGIDARAVAYVENVDTPESYGDNNQFKEQAAKVVFNVHNPFGDLSDHIPLHSMIPGDYDV